MSRGEIWMYIFGVFMFLVVIYGFTQCDTINARDLRYAKDYFDAPGLMEYCQLNRNSFIEERPSSYKKVMEVFEEIDKEITFLAYADGVPVEIHLLRNDMRFEFYWIGSGRSRIICVGPTTFIIDGNLYSCPTERLGRMPKEKKRRYNKGRIK